MKYTESIQSRNKQRILPCFFIFALAGCSSSASNPGFSIHSTPPDFKLTATKSCVKKYDEWEALANIPLRPTLGTSKIKQILSSIHNLGLTYLEGCPDAGIEKNVKKGFIYLQLANEFEYIPTRYYLGKSLIEGGLIEKDLELGTAYLQQVIYCDASFGSTYRKDAEAILTALNHPFSSDTSQFDKNCNQIRGAYFKGPSVEFDALAFKTDWESRSDTISENWGWLGAGFRGTTTIVRDAIPIALAGAAVYYSAKTSHEYRHIPEYSSNRFSRSSGSDENTSFPSTHKPQDTSYNVPLHPGLTGQNQIFTSSVGCTSDFQCGIGKVCVKPHDGVSLKGLCGTLINEFGVPTFTVPTPSAVPHNVSACMFDLDCPLGFNCRKTNHEVSGVCMR